MSNAEFSFKSREVTGNAEEPMPAVASASSILRQIDESRLDDILVDFANLGYCEMKTPIKIRNKTIGFEQMMPLDSVEHTFWQGLNGRALQVALVNAINIMCPDGVHFSGTMKNPKGFGFWSDND